MPLADLKNGRHPIIRNNILKAVSFILNPKLCTEAYRDSNAVRKSKKERDLVCSYFEKVS